MAANLWFAALSGLIGAGVMTVIIYLFKRIGIRLDIPYLLGTRFVAIDKKRKVYITGLLLHLVLGVLWGIVYVYLMNALAVRPDWPSGILFGFAHGIFSGAIIGSLSQNHPYIGTGKPIDDPGMFGSRWGTLVPYALLLLHIIFGVVVMLSYDRFFHMENIPRM